MPASVIWYRVRPSGHQEPLAALLEALGEKSASEVIIARPEVFPETLSRAVRFGWLTVVVGGLEALREEENSVFLLARCLGVRLETGRNSRSKFIHDTIRGTTLPTLESAVLFPSVKKLPEGSALISSGQVILLLPGEIHAFAAAAALMASHLPDMLDLAPKNEVPIQEDRPGVPAYIRKFQDEQQLRDREKEEQERAEQERRSALMFGAEELKALLTPSREDNPRETNRADMPGGNTAGRRYHFRAGELIRAANHQNAESKKTAAKSFEGRIKAFSRVTATILLFVIIISACFVGFKYYQTGLIIEPPKYGSELRELFGDASKAAELPAGMLPDFSALYAKNSDVAGFLSIPGTDIALPVMRSSADQPYFYAANNFYRQSDSRGSLRFDPKNEFEITSNNANTVIYGSSPPDGSMFAELARYTERDFYAEHQIIEMDTVYDRSKWIVFSACIVSGDTVGDFNYANTEFYGPYAHETFLYNLFVRSLFYTPVEVFPSERTLTLVTDSDEFQGAKLIVVARRVRDVDDLSMAELISGGVVKNDLVLISELWYDLKNANRPNVPLPELPTETVHTTTTSEPAATETTAPPENGETTTSDSTAAPTSTATTVPTLPPSASGQNMRITSNGKVIDDTPEHVLAMIIEAEMGSGYSPEALKAQAVAAYTYYLYSGGRAKAPAFPTKTAGDECKAAAAAVAGQYMKVNGKVPYTPYYAISAGYTANNRDINGAELGYLVSVDCPVDRDVSGFTDIKTVSAAMTAAKVLSAKGIDLTQIPDKSQWFTVLERDENGLYVKSVQVGGSTFRGGTLHLSILGYSFLRSPCFWIEYDPGSDSFIFTSQGYGTGVGMSQKGANEYARQGHNYGWILQHFYTGVTIVNQ